MTEKIIDGEVDLDTGGATRALRSLIQDFNQAHHAISTAVDMVQRFSERLVDSAVSEERHERAVRSLGGAYDSVRRATNDTVSAEQAWRVQNELSQAGMHITGEQLGTVTARAREYANATGTDLDQALQQVTESLRGLTAEGLRRFGASVDANHTRTQNLNSVLSQMRTHLHQTGTPARTLAEEVAHTSRAFDNFRDSMAGSIARALQLREVLSGLGSLISGEFGQQQNQQARAAAQDNARASAAERYAAALASARSAGLDVSGLPSTRDLHNISAMQLETLATMIADPVSRAQGQRFIDRLAHTQAQLTAAQQERVARETAATTAAEQAAATVDPTSATSSGSQSHTLKERLSDELTDFNNHQADLAEAAARRIQESADRFYATFRTAEERMQSSESFGRDVLDPLSHAADNDPKDLGNGDDIGGSRGKASEAAKAQTAAEAAAARTNDTMGVLHDRFAQHAELTQTTAQGMAETVEGAYNTMTGALKSHIAAVIQGKEDVGTALKATVQEVLLNLATESAVKAIFQTAEGIGAAAMGNYPGAAQHFTSAAIYGAVALGAGAGYAGLNAIGGSPSAAASSAGGGYHSSGAAAGGPSKSDSGAGQVTYVVNISGVMGNEQTQDVLRNTLQDMHVRGATPQFMRRD